MNSGFYGFPNILGLLRGTNLKVLGKAGATAGAGLAGGTTSGAPTSGQFDVGEAVIAQNGHLFICTAAGTPGTWADAGTASDPTTSEGDVIYRSAGTLARLAIGATAGAALLSTATDPYWGDAALAGPTRWEAVCDSAGSVLVAGSGDPVMALVGNP